MVCIYCQHETHVTNSRSKARTPSVWRRRVCMDCARHFTTNELPDYQKSLLVTGTAGKKHAFNRDQLFLSIHKALGYRKDSIDSSTGLTSTVISKLVRKQDGVLTTATIAKVTQEVLKRFDPLAATTYKAYHQPALKKSTS